jgi:pimeloyl-ACP methyl ester carboxylesterase
MKPVRLQRTRFGEIVAEFMPPGKRSNKVVIFSPGVPSLPPRSQLAEFFARKGFWFFAPRYRGSWESGGKFLAVSPEKDILKVMNQLARGFRDAQSGEISKIKSPELLLLGGSFGGPAAMLHSKDPRVRKVITVSPVVDWRAESRAESIDSVRKFTTLAFGEAYRFSGKAWAKLKTGTFYNPASSLQKIDGKKIVIVHAKDDRLVSFGPVKRFAKETGAHLILLPRGGHLSSTIITKPSLWKKIKKS